MSGLIIEDLLEAKKEVEKLLQGTDHRNTIDRVQVGSDADVELVKFLGCKVEIRRTVPARKAWLISGQGQVLGWMDFDQDKAFMFTEEQLEKHRNPRL